MLQAIIVDDEWLVRTELQKLLSEFDEIKIVGEAASVQEAIHLIETFNPQLIFLDIQMPGQTGFDLVEKYNIKADVIFITAYDQYAIRAFEVNALDYLLKPISKARLAKALTRISDHQIEPNIKNKIQYDDIIFIKIDGVLKFIKVESLKAVVAEGNYSFIYFDNKKELVLRTLNDWEQLLPLKYFKRIHRSTIINLNFINKVEKLRNYTQKITLEGISEFFIMSRRFALKYKSLQD